MNIDALIPRASHRTGFRRNCVRHVPAGSGCYVLTTFEGTILYVGLSDGLDRRMIQHLDTPAKVRPTTEGRAVWFHWLVTPDVNTVERTWLNMHLLAEGRLPVLNRLYSPTAT